MTIKLFFCYAHEDEPFLDKIKKCLSPLYRQGLIDVWYDRDINAGAQWELEIIKHLNEASIILLLISPDFINSDYCYGIEMQRAIQRYQRGESVVIPVILRPIHWKDTPFGKLQALPKDGKPVTSANWHTEDEALFNVAEGIRKTANNILKRAVFSDGPGNGTQLMDSQQFNSSIQVPLNMTKRFKDTFPQSIRTSLWRRFFIMLGLVFGIALTIIGIAGFLATYTYAIDYPSADTNEVSFILDGICIFIAVPVFCISAVSKVGKYISGFASLVAITLIFTSFFQANQRLATGNFIGAIMTAIIAGIFYWTTRKKNW